MPTRDLPRTRGSWHPVRRAAGAAALASALLAGATGCGGGSGDATREIGGTIKVEIYDQSMNQIPEGVRCSLGPRFTEGSEVLVRDGSGVVVAVGSLSGGLAVDPHDRQPGLAKYCRFDVAVSDVPPSEIYQVVVADRVAFTGTAEQLSALDWTLDAAIAPR